MIEWLDKLPDSVTGILLAGTAWFGFNYAILGERAMDRYGTETVMPSCVASIDEYQRSIRPPTTDLGFRSGMPEIDAWIGSIGAAMMPRMLTKAQALARCECAVAENASALRFDFALHTATFRYWAPDKIADFRSKTVDFALDGKCGALPENPFLE